MNTVETIGFAVKVLLMCMAWISWALARTAGKVKGATYEDRMRGAAVFLLSGIFFLLVLISLSVDWTA